MFNGSGNGNMPMAPGTAGALTGGADQQNPGVPTPQNPGGGAEDQHAFQQLMQQYNLVDSAIRSLRQLTLQAMPGSSRPAMKLDKMCYDLGAIRGEIESEYTQQQQDQMIQGAAQMMM